MSIPNYRIRIFVSVDLVGSTDFKAKKGNSFEWLKAFQMFYSNFKKNFIENYKKCCDEKKQYITHDERNELPKLWKTIGDEILFVNRLNSLCHLSCYISAFIRTLNEFGDVIKTFGLDTKGNAWVAAFPTPNCSIKSVLAHDEDPICGENGFTSEKIEAGADSDPRDFDFLGRNIDAGFRISRNSSVNSLTISPSLAYLLCRAKTNADPCFFPEKINFLGLEVFKGVVKNKPYPIITIDTIKNQEEKIVIQYEKKTYNKFEVDDFFEFKEYIRSYLKINELDILDLKVTGRDNDFDSPQKYKNYVAKYNQEKNELEQKSNQSEKENPKEEAGSEENLKIVQDGLNITQ